jgi:hypothetical protein
MQFGAPIFQPSVASGYYNILVMAEGGFVYVGNGGSMSTAGNQSAAFLSSTVNVAMCYLNLKVYMNDGQSTASYLDLSTGDMQTYVTSTGLAPTFCSQNATWRGRLVMFQDANDPQNIYASRIGDAEDMDFAEEDPAAAWAGNFSDSGQIGQPLTAFIPFNDDLAIVSCIDQMWLIEGDPSDGGSFVLMSDHMGMVGPTAYCTDPQHTVYFVGTSGLYSLRPFWAQYQPPQLLSGGKFDQYFQAIDRNQSNITMAYDEVNKYIHIYVSPRDQSVGEHLIYDLRNQGFWPIEYAPGMGPACVASYCAGYVATQLDDAGLPIGPTSAVQTIALGGWDGYVYQVNQNASADENIATTGPTAINSDIVLIVANPNPAGEAVLNMMQMDGGELPPQYPSWNASVTIVSGAVAADVNGDDTPPLTPAGYQTWVGSVGNDRRAPIMRPRRGGAWFSVSLANSTLAATNSLERLVLTFSPMGLNRRQR